jgi:hypothetical protein
MENELMGWRTVRSERKSSVETTSNAKLDHNPVKNYLSLNVSLLVLGIDCKNHYSI